MATKDASSSGQNQSKNSDSGLTEPERRLLDAATAVSNGNISEKQALMVFIEESPKLPGYNSSQG